MPAGAKITAATNLCMEKRWASARVCVFVHTCHLIPLLREKTHPSNILIAFGINTIYGNCNSDKKNNVQAATRTGRRELHDSMRRWWRWYFENTKFFFPSSFFAANIRHAAKAILHTHQARKSHMEWAGGREWVNSGAQKVPECKLSRIFIWFCAVREGTYTSHPSHHRSSPPSRVLRLCKYMVRLSRDIPHYYGIDPTTDISSFFRMASVCIVVATVGSVCTLKWRDIHFLVVPKVFFFCLCAISDFPPICVFRLHGYARRTANVMLCFCKICPDVVLSEFRFSFLFSVRFSLIARFPFYVYGLFMALFQFKSNNRFIYYYGLVL